MGGTLMAPSHRRWREFTERLEGPEGCNFTQSDPEDAKTIRWRCGNTHAITKRVLKAMGVRVDVAATLEFFEENGAHCACEVLFNVERNAS